MVDIYRNDGKPFVKDKRGAIPRYVIEDDEGGVAIIVDQFTGIWEIIGNRPYSKNELRRAVLLLQDAGRMEKGKSNE